MEQTQVVAAIIKDGPKFLMGKRSLSKKSAPGYWSPISGRIEPGESEANAIIRECFEEVGLTVETIRKVTSIDIDKGLAHLHWWFVKVVSGEAFLKNDEHSELRWFTLEELKTTPQVFSKDIEILAMVDDD